MSSCLASTPRPPALRLALRTSTLCLTMLGITGTAIAQPDTTFSADRRPQKALVRALMPGWGQLYNRQYLKIPLVYAGLGLIGAGAAYANGRYLRYRHAYLFTAREDDAGQPVFPEYARDYALLLSELGLPPESSLDAQEIARRRARLEPQFRTQRDSFRRNRDLLYIGIGIWYGLTILDAFVSAQLFEFDVGEDLALSMAIQPGPAGMSATIVLYR